MFRFWYVGVFILLTNPWKLKSVISSCLLLYVKVNVSCTSRITSRLSRKHGELNKKVMGNNSGKFPRSFGLLEFYLFIFKYTKKQLP